jgi:hypothetical protein
VAACMHEGRVSVRHDPTCPPGRMAQQNEVRLILLLVLVSYKVTQAIQEALTEFGHSKERTSPSLRPSLCRRPHAHFAASVRSPTYVRVFPKMVSTCTTLSGETLSGLYFVMNCGIDMLSSSNRGPYVPTIIFDGDILNEIFTGARQVRIHN